MEQFYQKRSFCTNLNYSNFLMHHLNAETPFTRSKFEHFEVNYNTFVHSFTTFNRKVRTIDLENNLLYFWSINSKKLSDRALAKQARPEFDSWFSGWWHFSCIDFTVYNSGAYHFGII